MPQRTETLPIVCVEGWSADATWTGVSVADVLRRAGIEAGARDGSIGADPRRVPHLGADRIRGL